MSDAGATTFGQYELVSRIGQGGMGETWKARRLTVANAPFVVIKRILPQFAGDPDFVESFVNEAHVTASLQHPAIAQVLDFGQVDGEYFFVIEFVHGRTVEGLLSAAAERGLHTLPVPVACFIALEILAGLEYAHRLTGADGQPLKIVHRDISPDNLLIGFDGSLKLVDFGVAKSKLKGRRETQTGQVKGKWPYFSPEQARGEPLDGRSDLWALGVVLYRMVCGTLPFDGQWFQAAQKIIRGEYARPLALNPRLPTPVVDAIDRALQVNLGQRFVAAENMATGLRAALAAAAPDFDRAMFKGFVHWAFAGDLEAERVQSSRSATANAQIALWIQEASAAAAEAPGRAKGAPSAPAMTAQTRGVRPAQRPGPSWVWAMVGLVLLGAGATAALLRSPPGSAEPTSADLRDDAIVRLDRAYTELNARRPELAPRVDQRFRALNKDLRAGGDPANDARLLAASVALEDLMRSWLAEPPRPPLVPLDAGLRPEPAPAEPIASPIELPPPVPTGVDVIRIDPKRQKVVTLRAPRHNLLPLLTGLDETQRITFPTSRRVVVRSLATSTLAIIAGARREFVLSSEDHGYDDPIGTLVRFIDFHPLMRNTDGVPLRQGSIGSADDRGQVRSAMALRVTQEQGRFVLVRGFAATSAASIWVRQENPAVTVVANCGNQTGVNRLLAHNVEGCGLALITRLPNATVKVLIDTDLSSKEPL